jgi:hypothetical protein
MAQKMNSQKQPREIRTGDKIASRFPAPETVPLHLLPPDAPTRTISASKRRLTIAIDHSAQIPHPVKIIHADPN